MKVLRIPAVIVLTLSAAFFPVLFTEDSYASCINTQQAETNATTNPPVAPIEGETVVVTTQVTCGGDDVSYRVAIPSSIIFASETYTAVYATTNSVITFGRPDGTYWTYPSTPSISIASQDWVAYPSQHPDEHFIINTSAEGFQIDLAARPYANQNIETLTTIITTAVINADTTLNITYVVNNVPNGTRTGARLSDGTIVTLEQAGVIQVQVAPPPPGETPTVVIVPDTPTVIVPDTPTVTPSPVPSPTPSESSTVTPADTSTSTLPSPQPTPSVSPEPLPSPTPTPTPTPSPEPSVEPTPTPTPEPTPSPVPTQPIVPPIVIPPPPAPQPAPQPVLVAAPPAPEPVVVVVPVVIPDPEPVVEPVLEPPAFEESTSEPSIEQPVLLVEPPPIEIEPPVEAPPTEEPPALEENNPPDNPIESTNPEPAPESNDIPIEEPPVEPPIVIDEPVIEDTPKPEPLPETTPTIKGVDLVPNSPEQLPVDIPKPAPKEVLIPHVQVDVAGVENGGIQFFGTQSQPQVVQEDGTLTPAAPLPGSGEEIPPEAITTEDTFIGQVGGTTFNAPDIAVPVELIPIEIPAALDAIPGAGEAVQAINKAYVALANIGNDMSPITRKKAKKILVITAVLSQVSAFRRRM